MNFDVSGKLTNTGGGALVPIGALMPYAGASAPANWLICNGQAVSRITYAELFALLGTTYGSGNGSSTFNVPNLQGRGILGVNSTYTRGSTGGNANHTPSGSVTVNGHKLTIGEMPFHHHNLASTTSYSQDIIGYGYNANSQGVGGNQNRSWYQLL